ncbi:PH domain-containing protein [Oscillospiraceae bacterium PP1C4]
MRKCSSAVRTHPFTIATYLYRFLFLLIIPVTRGFLSALEGDVISWLRGAWLDLTVIALILMIAYLKWHFSKYYVDNHRLYFTSGILFKREVQIPMQRICLLCALRPFWLRPFRVVKLRVDTIARNLKKTDLQIYIREADAKRIMALRTAPNAGADGGLHEYRPGMLNVVFLSLFTSNSFIGILFIATFISQAGNLVGQELSSLLISTFEEIAQKVAFGLPPIAASIALALLVGWLAAFLINLLQTKNLCTRRIADALHVEGGVLVQKEYSLRAQDISFVDMRQSLLTRLLRLYSIFINAVGFGKDKSDITAIIPFSVKRKTLSRLGLLLPEFTPLDRTLKPKAADILKFILDPLYPCVLIPAAAVVLSHRFPSWKALIQFAGFMMSVPALWFMGVRLVDFFSSGVSRAGEFFTLRYSKWFYLHTVVISYEKITQINIRQSIFQRHSNKCDLIISSRAEGRTTHHLRSLDRDACIKLFHAAESA